MIRSPSFRTILGFCFFAGAALFPATQTDVYAMESQDSTVSQEPQTTMWVGTLNAGGNRLRLEIDIRSPHR